MFRFLHILLHVICVQLPMMLLDQNVLLRFYTIYDFIRKAFNSDSLLHVLYKHVAKACMAPKKTMLGKANRSSTVPVFSTWKLDYLWCNHGATRIVLTLLRVAIDDIMIIIKINVNAILNFHKDKNVKYNRI